MIRRSSLRRAVVTAVACAAGWLAAAPGGAVTCDPSHFPSLDGVTFLPVRVSGFPVTTMRCQQTAPNWAAYGVLGFSPSSDFDVKLYTDCLGGTLLASSQSFGGTTDFVIGDFNNNPTGWYAADAYCYSGDCNASTGVYGAGSWRTGGLMFVDFPPTTVTYDVVSPYNPDAVLRVWDVWLSAGTTYWFQFSSTLGSGSKMMLFRNPSPGGGTFWGGRGSADFSVSGCTSYTAPVTGYYGLVVVNDVWAAATYTVGVTTALACGCAEEVPRRTPVTVPASPATAYRWFTGGPAAWVAFGERPDAGSDWDLELSTSGTTPGCAASVLANSVAGSSVADFVVADLNFESAPSTLSARLYRYSGAGGATAEWDGSVVNTDLLWANGPRFAQPLGASDVLKCWDVYLDADTTYTFEYYGSPNTNVFLFRNPGSGLYATGRAGAVFSSNSTFNYTAPTTGWYGIVVAKDDADPGYYSLRVGTCASPLALVPGIPLSSAGAYTNVYASITATAGSWHAVGSRSAVDWDLRAFAPASGAPWPECFVTPLVGSESASLPDFIVGDFHVNPAGTYPFRWFQFASGAPVSATLQWTGPATDLVVDAPAITVTPNASDILRAYQVTLLAGRTYQIEYVQSDSRPLLVYGHLTADPYWAPRGAALLSTTTSASFTPPTSSSYAIVVANDAAESGSFTLRVRTLATTDADTPASPHATSFADIRPNPARAGAALRYTLATPARVRFDVLDLTGRRVWSEDVGEKPAGAWSVPLRRDVSSSRLPAGLYFVHFVVDGRAVEVRKVTLLD